MTQPPYVPARDDDNTERPNSGWPTTAAEQTDTELFASQFPDPAQTGSVSSVSMGEYGTDQGSSSTKDVAKEQAGQVKDTAAQQGQQVAGVAKEQAGQVKDTAVQQGQQVAGVAKEQASQVRDTAVQQGQQVAGVAKEQASKVAAEASSQVKDLVSSGLSEARGALGSQQKRLAGGIHSLADELGTMAAKSDAPSLVTNYAQQASRRTGELAHWLENAEPSDVLAQLRSFARRRPAMFLGASALAGVIAGRLSRSFAANAKSESQGQLTSGTSNSTPTSNYSTTSSYGTTGNAANSPYSQDYTPGGEDMSGAATGYSTNRPDYVDDVDQTGAGYGKTGRDGVL